MGTPTMTEEQFVLVDFRFKEQRDHDYGTDANGDNIELLPIRGFAVYRESQWAKTLEAMEDVDWDKLVFDSAAEFLSQCTTSTIGEEIAGTLLSLFGETGDEFPFLYGIYPDFARISTL